MATRDEIVGTIDAAVVELRGVAQPHEVAALRELRRDANEADAPELLAKIEQQVKSLVAFCRSRAMTQQAFQAVVPEGRKRT
jgi:hypothetical protein